MDFVTDEEERPRGADVAAEMASSGALDEIFAKIDAGELELTGSGGFIPGLIKAALERGLQAELSQHLGYEKGAPEASLFANSRNGVTSKRVSSQVGAIDLDTPRDREGSFIPRLVPKGSRRMGGLDEMIISLYAGGMTIADIEHHLASTIGTELSRETISKITDEVLEEVLAWQRRPLVARPRRCTGSEVVRGRVWARSGPTHVRRSKLLYGPRREPRWPTSRHGTGLRPAPRRGTSAQRSWR